jgi:excinuclease ABC subunit C
MVQMVQKNAQLALEKETEDESSETARVLKLLSQLQEELGITKLPRRIECFDISNIQGFDNVASLVVFENGKAKKSDYRLFKIRSVEGLANDFASMKEVVERRYSRLLKEEKPLPDLIIIDGGKGQLNAAQEALNELKLKDQQVIGLAKKQEEVYLPGQSAPILLSRRNEALFLLQRARDEAHRFALTFHRKRRAKRTLISEFDTLEGVGKARRKSLIDRFGSFDRLKQASLEEIESLPNFPKNLAARIFAATRPKKPAEVREQGEAVNRQRKNESNGNKSDNSTDQFE